MEIFIKAGISSILSEDSDDIWRTIFFNLDWKLSLFKELIMLEESGLDLLKYSNLFKMPELLNQY
jgi:hypothetical protein